MNKIANLSLSLTLTLAIMITLTPFFSTVMARTVRDLTYGGPMESTDVRNQPVVTFSIENDSILYDVGNFNVGFVADIRFPDLLSIMVALYSVSYKTSWEDEPAVIYEWSINAPGDLFDDDDDPLQSFFYAVDISSAPQGLQSIEVSVNGGGYVTGFGHTYWTVSTKSLSTLYLNITAPPSPTQTSAAQAWNVQTVDEKGAGGYLGNCPIALDSNNSPHIAYTRLVNSKTTFVMYASWNHSCWSTQTVAPGKAHGLVLDSDDTPHVLYEEGSSLMYSTWEGTEWISQTIDEVSDSSGAIALDSHGKPYVAYNDGKTVKYANWTGNYWAVQTIEVETPTRPNKLSLAFDKNNTPYLLYSYSSPYKVSGYINDDTKIVKIAVRNNSKWSIQTVPLEPPIGGYGNIVLDSKGNPHFIYSQDEIARAFPLLGTVIHCSWNGTAWNTQIVDSNVTLQFNYPGTNWANMGVPYIRFTR